MSILIKGRKGKHAKCPSKLYSLGQSAPIQNMGFQGGIPGLAGTDGLVLQQEGKANQKPKGIRLEVQSRDTLADS